MGLEEGLDDDYLRYRLQHRGNTWASGWRPAGVGFVRPTGGHAVYIDARTVLPTCRCRSTRAGRWRWRCTWKAASAPARSAR